MIKDLREQSGIDIKLESTGLVYDQNMFPVEPKVRLFDDAKQVYLSEEAPESELYYMYRYFEAVQDVHVFADWDVEYDITAINSGLVGSEYIKTVGHYHSYVPNSTLTYPEVYEVIAGKIEYLLQTKPDMEGNVDVILVEAVAGDKVVVPPGYGHISVNVGDDVAVSSNIQKRDLPASSDYGSFENFKGGALYRKNSGWENNPAYKIRSIKRVAPKEKPDWGLEKDVPLYHSFVQNPGKFSYITNPKEYDFSGVFEEINPL